MENVRAQMYSRASNLKATMLQKKYAYVILFTCKACNANLVIQAMLESSLTLDRVVNNLAKLYKSYTIYHLSKLSLNPFDPKYYGTGP